MKTPTLALASLDDQLISIKTNTLRLKDALSENSKSNCLATVVIAKGNHCAFNAVYGWRIATALMRSDWFDYTDEP